MDVIIREAKDTKNMFQIEIYDPDFCQYSIVENVYFENESFAEKYGREMYSFERNGWGFSRVVMKDGKEVPADGIKYIDANYPGELYIVPKELEKEFKEYMTENGAAEYKTNRHWIPNDWIICRIKQGDKTAYPPFKFCRE